MSIPMATTSHISRADCGRRRPHLPRALLTLALVGSVLCLWTQPAAASPTITEFPVSSVGVPQGIAAGPDGNLWFTWDSSSSPRIGRITPGGAITLMLTPTPNAGPTDITAGPDGNTWFTEAIRNIGRITTH
jgi:streptogramin lyase